MNYSSFEIEKVNVLEVPVVLDQYLAAWKLVLIFAPHDLAVCLLKALVPAPMGAPAPGLDPPKFVGPRPGPVPGAIGGYPKGACWSG
jgi:hypothetical protein